ncbi:diguanylate cyclase [Shewanella sp. 10N.286.51.B2]|uniref:sensor domain-containing diguanylate cyclase n=1 Tax=unclassified Shewanella TaxID=196818 RepID=UPI0026E2E79C|nr:MULTISPECIES: diguanylate cyclase [unclassified Shewanella]MDO6679407.1 diguanylate cyclase [Shewanella sp. 4_MG-2023]MDO6775377.1 diguanylate cyclase [Shewanella sp. 3_MG-2023]
MQQVHWAFKAFTLFFIILLTQLQAAHALAVEHANPPLRLTASSITKIKLTDWMYINQSQDIEELASLTLLKNSQQDWRKLSRGDMRKIGAKNTWLSFSIFSPNDHLSRMIALNNPLLDSMKLYHLVNNKLVKVELMGDSYPFKQRPLQSNLFLYPFELQPNETHTFYLKIDNRGSLNFPLVLWSKNDYSHAIESQSLANGFQIGILIAIGLFSLFIALASGSFSYSYYSGYVLSLTLLVATIHGIAFQYLWPTLPVVQNLAIPILIPIALAFALMFTEKVMLLKYHNKPMLLVGRYLAVYCVLLSLVISFIDFKFSLYLLTFSVIAISCVLITVSLIQVIKGSKNARLYAIARIGLFIGAILSGLIYLGYLQWYMPAHTPMMIGLTFEVIVMAAVLAVRYNDERKAKLQMQKKALEQAQKLQQNRDEALKAEARTNERLEQMVAERTLELEVTLRELNDANQKLQQQSTTDSLTGVKNRNAFDKRLTAEGRISRRQQTSLAILMVDIDKFKQINDQFGHLAGDLAIKVIATTISEFLKRPTDLVSRFGGEEFAIILPNTDSVGAMLLAERIRQAISNLSIDWDNNPISLFVSIGVSAAIIETNEQPTQLLEQADKALYQAKRSGRNQVCLFSSD